MNSEQRVKLLGAIDELCRRYPEWRLGQLIANVSGWADREIWDIEDDEMLQAAALHLQEQSARTASTST